MSPEGTSAERLSRSSVTITRNTKGYSFEVKLYAGDTDVVDVLAQLATTVEALNAQYPRETA